jgi:hypothetical protein
MERHNASNYTYKRAAEANTDTGKPAIFNVYSPTSETVENKKFDLTAYTVRVNGRRYILKVVPVTGKLV